MRSYRLLSVTKPEEVSPDASEKNGTSEKPARLRQCPQAHKKHSDHNDQPDWVSRVMACTVPPDLTDLSWIKVGIVRGGLPPTVHRSAH